MFSKERLKEIIVGNREFILNYVGRIIKREGLYLPKRLNKVIVLYGVRRSGKTFILYALFRTFKDSALYIDFEDERLADFKVSDFEILKEAFLELNPHLINKPKTFLFDEIQNIKDWERFARRAVEKEKIALFVSGSSSKIMPQEIHTSLRGRAWSIEISPFSFKEYLKIQDILPNKDFIYTEKKIFLKNHFKDYLRWGGFPEIILGKGEFEKAKILKEYLGSIFFKDLVERFRINNIPLLELLIDALFSSFSQRFSLSSFYKQYKDKLPFSKDSLFSYYKYLLESMLIFEVRKFTTSSYKRMRNPAKVYLVDTGLARRITQENIGRLLENIVFLELRRYTENIFYFEEERECDFVVNKDGRLFVYQVCHELNEENRTRELDGLVSSALYIGLKEGCILTYDQEEELDKDGVRIKIMPVWKWIIEDANLLSSKTS
ncbi:MAG: ATP-binding protein [bacterium]